MIGLKQIISLSRDMGEPSEKYEKDLKKIQNDSMSTLEKFAPCSSGEVRASNTYNNDSMSEDDSISEDVNDDVNDLLA